VFFVRRCIIICINIFLAMLMALLRFLDATIALGIRQANAWRAFGVWQFRQ